MIASGVGPNGDAYFSMSFDPTLGMVALVRRFAEGFYQELLRDAEASGRLALCTHELLENAVKYCSEPPVAIRASITRHDRGFYVTVRARNRSRTADIERLRQMVDRLETSVDVDALYEDLVRAASTVGGRESRLGLARIRVEAEMALRLDIAGNDVAVTATASRRVKEPT
jgi:hypothetical protein